MLGFVLLVMVGEQAQEMQLASWIPTTKIGWLENLVPDWMGLWFWIFPTVETLVGSIAGCHSCDRFLLHGSKAEGLVYSLASHIMVMSLRSKWAAGWGSVSACRRFERHQLLLDTAIMISRWRRSR